MASIEEFVRDIPEKSNYGSGLGYGCDACCGWGDGSGYGEGSDCGYGDGNGWDAGRGCGCGCGCGSRDCSGGGKYAAAYNI